MYFKHVQFNVDQVLNCQFLTLLCPDQISVSLLSFVQVPEFCLSPTPHTQKVESVPLVSFSWKSADHSQTLPSRYSLVISSCFSSPLPTFCLSLLTPTCTLLKKKLFLFDSETLPDFWDQSGLPVTIVFLLNKTFPYLTPNSVFWHCIELYLSC